MNEHEKYMREALKLAVKAYKIDEVPVGAVIVKDGIIIAKGYNQREKTQSALKHAEIIAIEKACKKLKSWRLDGCDLYVTLEPCLMCAGAILQSRIKNVYYGANDLKAGVIESKCSINKIDFPHKVNYTSNILKNDSKKLLKSFFKELRSRKK